MKSLPQIVSPFKQISVGVKSKCSECQKKLEIGETAFLEVKAWPARRCEACFRLVEEPDTDMDLFEAWAGEAVGVSEDDFPEDW